MTFSILQTTMLRLLMRIRESEFENTSARSTYRGTVKWTQYSVDAVVGNGTAVRNELDPTGGSGRRSEFFAMGSLTYRWLSY